MTLSNQGRQTLIQIDRQLGYIAGLFAVVGSVAACVLMGITVTAVTWRYGLNNPIFGIEDLSIITLSVMVAASVAYGARKDAHVSVNIISYFFGPAVTRYTDMVMRVLVIAIIALAAWALFDKACGFEKACITSNFSIEFIPFYYILSAAMVFYCLQVILDLLRSLVDPRSEVSRK